KALISQKQEVVQSYRDKKYQSIVSGEDRIKVFMGKAELIDAHTARIGDQRITGEQVLIATGTRPAKPSIDGLDAVDYLTSDLLTSDESMELTELPDSLIIIGGGYIALELGQMFHRFGVQVTILEQSRKILSNFEPEVSRSMATILRAEGVNLVTSAPIQRVVKNSQNEIEVITKSNEGQKSYKAERLLVAAGRVPNTDEIGLEKLGIELDDKRFIKVSEELQTNVSTIWAAGDVIGNHNGSQLATPVGAKDGVLVAMNALANAHRKVDHRVIPRAIFTDPQVATVGLTDVEANASGFHCWCGTIPLDLVPRAGATHQTSGLAKMVINRETEEVLGVSLVMPNAGEVIHEAAMAMKFHAKLADYIDLIHVYPTMAEALKIAAISYYKDPTKLSCCAE
ncbi:MAG: FAD-dependent oxidoreductase, partial [Anaerolineales bacterium]|nr:FAD-dependent oxidoreductase [Anaerolineales bacterium]